MAASGKVLGTVTSVVGEAKATAADGTVRILQVGDIVRSDETITTSAAGAVNIALENGKTLDCGANTDLSLHEGILGVSTAASNVPGAPGAAAPGSVEALQQAIASGQDPSQIAPATAAGGAPAAGGAGGDGSGGTPVIVEQANASGPITAGFGTAGAGIAFPTPEFQLLVPTQQPIVSVSVQVQVEVGVTPGETPGNVTVPTNPVVSTNATGIVEGTDGEETRLVNFIIKLSQSFDTDVQVTYTIVSGPANPAVNADSAQTPSDYSGVLTATITIPAGATEFIVPVQIVQDHFVENNENFSIVLTSAENATIDPNHSSAVVTIQDDDTAPVAHADTNWTQEDTHIVATGNVIAGQAHAGAPSGSFADVQDTDADGDIPHVTTIGTFNGTYGTLVLNVDGTYVYTLNNASAAVQGLDTGETLQDSFNYTASDGFNAPSSSTLTVTIFGSNDVPEITVKTSGDIFASGAQGTVNEAALANGSNPSSNAEFVTGSFKVADTDGIDDIQSVTINGQTVAVGNLVGAVFHGSAGDMTVSSFSGGVANFTYELKHAVPDVANEAETDVFTLTASDGTSNSAPANVTITIIDDVPSIAVSATAAADTLTVDETNLAANATANFADNFTSISAFGADGAGSVGSVYALSVSAGPSGLVDTATGQSVNLSLTAGGVVEGRTAVSNDLVFTVSVNGSGQVTLDQVRAVVHPTTNPDEPTTLSGANLVTLTRTDTITDSDGDSANSSASISIGQALVFKDDGPDINVSTAQLPALTVDETVLATDASASFAGMFTVAHSSTDGGNTITYALNAVAGPSGLVDTATGQNVMLVMNGSVVEGQVSNGEGGPFVVFTVTVNSSGQVTLDQMRAVVHPTTNPDEPTTLSGANLVTLTAKITDADTDFDTATLNIGQSLIFKDDGPDINVTTAQMPGLTVDETVLATDASASFAGMFTVAHNSTDGGNTVTYALNVVAGPSGLVDTATGQSVNLSLTAGGVVEGRTSGSNDLVFTVSVDASANVKLDQIRAVVHPTTNPDEPTTLNGANLVTLTAKITDADTDFDTATLNIGQSLIFKDDGPDINLADASMPTLTVDETVLATNATASFAGTFAVAHNSTDGGNTITYTLNAVAGPSGLVDTATGQNVNLSLSGGGAVEGRTAVSNDLVFTVTVNGSGSVTLDQVRAVVHPTTNPDESKSLSAANLVTLTAKITDADTDFDTATLNIGQSLIFKDDGPSFTIINDGNDAGTTVSISAPNPASNTTFNGQFADWQYGADAAQGTPTLSGVTGNVTLSGASNANALVVELKDAGGAIIGTLTLNADGTDSLAVIHRASEIQTDELLTGEANPGGPELVKTVNSTLGLTVTVTASDGDGIPNEADDQVNPSTQGWAVKNNVIELDESIKFSLSSPVDLFSFRTDGYTGGAHTMGITVTVTYEGGATEVFTPDVLENQTIQVANLPGFNVGTRIVAVEVENDGTADSGGFRLNGVTISKVTETPAKDLDYNFTVNVVDKDGDPVAQAFSVHLDGDNTGGLVTEAIAGTSGANSLVGTAASDVLIPGGGHDTMDGGGSSDTFKFSGALDSNSSDTIMNFNFALASSGGDVLDLHDVLPAAAQGHLDLGTLGSYINVQTVGSDTVISVDADGGGAGAAVAVVTLQGITGVTLSQLLTNNEIHT